MPKSQFVKMLAQGAVAGAVCSLTSAQPDSSEQLSRHIELTDFAPTADRVSSAFDFLTSAPSRPVRVESDTRDWTAQMEHRYRDLTSRVALGIATAEEKADFDALVEDRRHLKNPRTSEEILWEHRQRQVTRKLLEAIAEYSKFHDRKPTLHRKS